MENFYVDNVWYVKNGSEISHFRSAVLHLLETNDVEYNPYIFADWIFFRGFRIRIYDSHVEIPRVVILPPKENTNLNALKAFISLLSGGLPENTVMIATNTAGCCPFCGTKITNLVFFPKNNLVPTAFGCCGYTFSFKDSLEILIQQPLMVSPKQILVKDRNTMKYLLNLFPNQNIIIGLQ